VAFDFSIMHQTSNEDLKVGVTLQNVGYQLKYYSDEEYKEKMPIVGVAGASYNFGGKAFLNFDLCRPFDGDFYGKFGFEYYLNPFLTLRTGVDTRMDDYKTNQDSDFLSGLAAGFGVSWNNYIIDYAVYSMGSLGLVNQISMSYKF
jgi:hypothetical protein